MKLIRNLDELPLDWRSGAVAIGNFDGVHLGHARIVERLVALARAAHGPAIVFTFDPSPAAILRPDHAPSPLAWPERRVELLLALGIDGVVLYPTDAPFLEHSAREFFDHIVRRRLDAQAMVEGPNFFFGRRREGNVGLLAEFCRDAQLALEIVPPVFIEGQMVSSSRVRKMVAAGEVELSARMLGRPHRIRGRVVRGAGRGRTLGFPTANVGDVDVILPGEGIYAGAAWADDRLWPAALSIGPNPTFDENRLKIEAYLVGYEGDLYERPIEIDFLARLRDIVRYTSVAELVEQLERDVAATRQVVARWMDRTQD